MLGLPSTTHVGKTMPKDRFYRNLSVSAQLKEQFTHKVERFVIEHSIQPAHTNIPAGTQVAEVLVMQVELRQREVPGEVLSFIANAIPNKLLFVCTYEGEACLAVQLKKLVVGEWAPLEGLELDLRSDDMDAFWDSLASQVAYCDKGLADTPGASTGGVSMSVEERFAHDEKLRALRDEIAKLDTKCRKEKQFNKKNALLKQLAEKRAKLAEFERDGMTK